MICHVMGCGAAGVGWWVIGNVRLVVCRACSEYAPRLGGRLVFFKKGAA